MASDAVIQFSFAGLPPNYCFSGYDRFALDIVNNMTGFIPGEYSVIIDSATEPDAEDRNKLWHKQLGGGAPSGKLYSYYLGKWVTPHPIEAGAQMRMWWTGTEADLWAFDGGDGTDPSSSAPTATTGAMWSRDTDYDFRFPLAMGTSPAPTSTSVVPGDTGGVEEITQTEAQLAPHGHTGKAYSRGAITPQGDGDMSAYGSEITLYHENAGHTSATSGNGGNDSAVVISASDTPAESMSNMPPYRVGMWCARTARIYFVA